MKQLLSTIIALGIVALLNAQNKNYVAVSVYNTQSAMPFGKLAGLFSDQFHPGVEGTYGRNISTGKNHEWFSELRVSYFFHRYVQHAIPLYFNLGYRYKVNNKFSAETSVGAGYMHSIPATAKLKLNENGEYKNNKGIGRAQAMATFSLGMAYSPKPTADKPFIVFVNYHQRVQAPFIKSYVPLLPYTSFMIGVRKPIKNISNGQKS
ncbi:MAG TPA: hypothetical protein VFP97_02760 [Chitinophagaceae bacterium]|nr:hypothetical protein [Chitinophagaceae bacterium]